MESAVLRAFENAFGAAGAVLWAFDASRTTEACFAHRISLPYRRSLFFTPNASENASRTPGSLFEHGTHIPYHRRPSPVPNANTEAGLPGQSSSQSAFEAFWEHINDQLSSLKVLRFETVF